MHVHNFPYITSIFYSPDGYYTIFVHLVYYPGVYSACQHNCPHNHVNIFCLISDVVTIPRDSVVIYTPCGFSKLIAKIVIRQII